MPETPLVGRREELTRLLRLLADAVAGRGSLVVVTGEAGIGKSRLLRELEERARAQGTLVLRGAAVADGPAYRPVAQALLPVLRRQQVEVSPALRPYRSALGHLLPDWADHRADDRADEGAADRADDRAADRPADRVEPDPTLVLGEGVLRLLDGAAEGAGCLLMLEDAHWADPDSVALLRYLASAVHDSRVLVAVSVRADGSGVGLVGLLGAAPGVSVLRLAALAPAEVEQLAAAQAGGTLAAELAAYVVARADGVPLLVEELTRSVSSSARIPTDEDATAPVPASFAADVRGRLDSLSSVGREALRAAAVLGSEPDWSLLPAVTGRDADEVWSGLREAAAAHLLVQDTTGLRWRHALTQEAVAEGLLAPERAALARRAALVLLESGRPEHDEHAARLLLVAGETEQAADVALRAAVRERRRSAYANAERLLGLADAAGAPDRSTSERVLLLTLTGRPVAALEAGGPALERTTGDDHAELSLRLARAAIDDQRWAEAEEYVERAGRPDDARSATLAADAAHGAGRVDQAGALADRAVQLAESRGTPEQLCEALCALGRIARISDVATARSAFARAAQVGAEHGVTAARVEALLGLGTLELLAGAGSSTMRTARELALDLGLLSTALSAELLLCDDLLLDAGPQAVRERVAALVGQAGTLHLHGLRAMAATMLALSDAATGELASMEDALAVVTAGPGAGPDVLVMADVARAHAALLAHDLPNADLLLDRSVPLLMENRASAPLHVVGLWALLRTVAGNAGDGGRDAREAVRRAPAARRTANLAALRYADAVAAGRAGRRDEAAETFAEADGALSRTAWWRRVLRLLALERAVVDGWGDPVPELRANLAEHEASGEDRLAGTCRDLLRRAGAPTRRGRGAGPVPPQLRAAGVTSRELDVLRLVRDGRSNAEIAERLFLSTRTVETHVAHLLAKSGTTDRSGLASWFRGREDLT